MDRAALLGQLVGVAAHGDTVQLADLCRVVTRRTAIAPLVGIYFPPPLEGGRPLLALDRRLNGAASQYMRALALGHFLLGHQRFDAYIYAEHGALYGDPIAEAAARAFAAAFLRGRSDRDRG